jgi:hypothetical protein
LLAQPCIWWKRPKDLLVDTQGQLHNPFRLQPEIEHLLRGEGAVGEQNASLVLDPMKELAEPDRAGKVPTCFASVDPDIEGVTGQCVE